MVALADVALWTARNNVIDRVALFGIDAIKTDASRNLNWEGAIVTGFATKFGELLKRQTPRELALSGPSLAISKFSFQVFIANQISVFMALAANIIPAISGWASPFLEVRNRLLDIASTTKESIGFVAYVASLTTANWLSKCNSPFALNVSEARIAITSNVFSAHSKLVNWLRQLASSANVEAILFGFLSAFFYRGSTRFASLGYHGRPEGSCLATEKLNYWFYKAAFNTSAIAFHRITPLVQL